MGCASSNLNDTMAFIQEAREETANNKLDALMTQRFEISTSQHMELQLQDPKVKGIAGVIKRDAVEELVQLHDGGSFKINQQFGQMKLAAIHIAAYYGSSKILRTLLKYPGIDANVGNADGDTALMIAISSSDSDAKAFKLTKIFLAIKNKILLTKKNGNLKFPLIAAIQNSFKETAKLLVSPRVISVYTVDEVIIAVKMALRYHQDEVAEIIAGNIGGEKFRNLLQNITFNSKLYGIAQNLEKTIISNQNEGESLPDADNNNKQTPQLLSSVFQKKQSALTSMSVEQQDKLIEDAGSNMLKVGNVVKTLSEEAIRRNLPSDAKESSEVLKLADQKGIVHNIFDDKLYIELTDSNCMAVISAKSCVYRGDGQQISIMDEALAVVGAFVRVIENIDKLRELQESWRHGMEETCGKTGRVIRLSKENLVQVQFAWGARYYYKSSALTSSTDEEAITRDKSGNWLQGGCPVQIIPSHSDFEHYQEEISLPITSKYEKLVGKVAQMGKVKIKPFSMQKITSLWFKCEEYNVNVNALSLITNVRDSNDVEIYVGDYVLLKSDSARVLKPLQTPQMGGWSDAMMKCVKLPGVVKEFRVDGRFESDVALAFVEFTKGTAFFFNPKALVLLENESDTEKTITNQPQQQPPLVQKDDKSAPKQQKSMNVKSQRNSMNVDMENISRDALSCQDKLGEGGFGSVYKGTWTLQDGTKKTVAIKQMNYGVTSKNSYEDILKEAKIQFQLNHRNIVSLFGISYVEEQQQLWLVMRLVTGKDLLSILFPHKSSPKLQLSFRQKVKISLDISYAIAYIHDRGYLHADIKPQNMMLDQSTGDVYICDFGITKYLGPLDIQTYAATFTNSFAGTLLYVAPECLKQDKKGRYLKPTLKSDVWSLGASFFEIFTEKHLFDEAMVCYKCKIMNDSDYVQKYVAALAPRE